jgi:hypothetical protein
MIGMLHLGKMVLVGNRLLALKNKNKNKQTKKTQALSRDLIAL